MRKRILAAVSAAALLLGLGAAAGIAYASGPPSVLCAKTGSRDLKVYEGCPAGYFQAQLPQSAIQGLDAALAAKSGDPAAIAALVKAEVSAQLAAGGGGATSKHAVVTFDADWATNAKIKQLTKCPILKLTGISTTINGQFLDPTTVSYGAETKGTPTASSPQGRYCFAFLNGADPSAPLPKYSNGQPELWFTNVSDSTMASESDVSVLGEVLPSLGATTRTFVVSVAAAADGSDPLHPGTIKAFSNSRSFTVDAATFVP